MIGGSGARSRAGGALDVDTSIIHPLPDVDTSGWTLVFLTEKSKLFEIEINQLPTLACSATA